MDIPNNISKNKKSFIQVLVWNCQSIASAMRESGRIDDEKYLEVLLEHLYLYLNITNRMAFSMITDKQRDRLMTEIEEISISLAIEAACGHWPEDTKNNIYREAMQNFYNAMQEFSQYKVVYATIEEGVKDTLIWEFCKNITKMTGNEDEVGEIVGHAYVVMTALKSIDIKSFIEKIK